MRIYNLLKYTMYMHISLPQAKKATTSRNGNNALQFNFALERRLILNRDGSIFSNRDP